MGLRVRARQIKEKALESGFHLVGIAPAMKLPEADAYRQWLERGFAADMAYMARNVEKREDCRVLFPPARSVIVCGMSYHSSFAKGIREAAPGKGWISRYAWGDDYHHVVKQKLHALVDFLHQETGISLETKVCVDTVPILERLYANAAGLGWIGKHGGVINHQYGSWCFLGEILVDIELDYDSPVPDRCGTCRRCLDACPTGALVAPRQLDARRCLSYVTIESKGDIPVEFRTSIADRVFGCDRCQEVCPWNLKAEAPEVQAFLPRDGLYQPDLSWLLQLSQEQFSRLFKNSPIKRRKLQGMLRNAAVAAGNSRSPNVLPALRTLEEQSDSGVRTYVSWAQEQLNGESQKDTESTG